MATIKSLELIQKNTQDTCRKKNKERIQPSPKLKPTTSYPKIATYVLQRGFIS